MKKILLSVLCCFVVFTIYAQNEVQVNYSTSGGLLGAANLSQFRTDNDEPTVDYGSKMGWALGGWINFPVSSGFSVEPQVMFSSYRYHTNSTTPGLLLTDGSLRYISVPVLLKFHAGEKFAFTAGPQVDFLTSVGDDDKLARIDDFTRTSFSLSGGIEICPHGKVTVFGRYIHGFSNMDDRANHTSTIEYKNSNVQFGLKVKLFGKKETETFRATTVTVPLDTDGDGITDDLDKCPTQAGTAKYNGCPIPDSDGDGINDELDKCPNQAGTAKYEGCPVPDKDNDGINDEEDKCPDVAGVASNNGCPEVPANVSKTLGLSAQNISFGTTNAKLTTRSNASLDQVVAIMNENPTLHIRVQAHTDNAGDDDTNMKLTEDRAAAVKAYLVSKGIAEDRITSEGFGETMPIADNSTASGRVKNRRVEIKVDY